MSQPAREVEQTIATAGGAIVAGAAVVGAAAAVDLPANAQLSASSADVAANVREVAAINPMALENAKRTLKLQIEDGVLNISNRGITDEEFETLTELLKDNYPGLKALILNDCFINPFILKPKSMQPILDALKKNKVVTTLDLSCNNIDHYLEISIQDDNAKKIGGLLKENDTITSLHLNYCGINPKRMLWIAEGLELNQKLRFLGLQGNPIENEGTKTLVAAILNRLRIASQTHNTASRNYNGALVGLDLSMVSSSFIGTEGAKEIGVLLAGNPFLTSLDISINHLSSESMRYIAIGLEAVNQAIQRYTASADSVSDLGLAAIVAPKANKADTDVAFECYTARCLEIANQAIQRIVTSATATVSASSIASSSAAAGFLDNANAGSVVSNPKILESLGLQTLILRGNSIGPENVQTICRALCLNRNIRVLDLSNGELKDAGAVAVANLLARNGSITSLKLQNNAIGLIGLKAIMAVLAPNAPEQGQEAKNSAAAAITSPQKDTVNSEEAQGLVSLDLSRNRSLGAEECVTEIARCLRTNSTLRALYLNSTPLRSSWTDHLAPALRVNRHLKILGVANCNITYIGSLADALTPTPGRNELPVNQTLTSLDCSNNQLWDSIELFKVNALCIRNLLQYNTGLSILNLTCLWDTPARCRVQWETKERAQPDTLIAAGLRHNQSLTALDIRGHFLEPTTADALLDAVRDNRTRGLTFLDFGPTAETNGSVQKVREDQFDTAETLCQRNTIKDIA